MREQSGVGLSENFTIPLSSFPDKSLENDVDEDEGEDDSRDDS